MRRLALGALALAVVATVAVSAAGTDDYPERAREVVRRTLAFAGPGPYRLEVDNVFGAIAVSGHDGRQVELVATRTTFARADGDLALAAGEVTLETVQEAGAIRLVVDGPFRDCTDGRRRSSRRRDYTVRYDFALEVPRDAEISLRTVNDGDINVVGVRRGFDLENVNGGIEALDVAGTGRAHTVNGDVRVVFRENPPAASSFASINGDLVVSLQPGLAADLRLKTFNGRIYTDFDVTRLPAIRSVAERRDGKFVYRSDGAFAVRVGAGGPELRFDAFNGDIRILRGGR